MNDSTGKRDVASDLFGALRSDGPQPEFAEKLELFGQFVGDWDVVWKGTDNAGKPASAVGELSFGWILDGRALQDVWRVPSQPAPPELGSFHGTTVRFYDPKIDAWQSTWIEPFHGRVRRFIGHPDGADIVLDEIEAKPAERWCFRDISGDAFRWTAEVYDERQDVWVSDEEMYITRRV